jgi:hypothetical protein
MTRFSTAPDRRRVIMCNFSADSCRIRGPAVVVGPLSWLTLGLVAFLVRAAFFFLVGYVAHLKLPVDPRSSVAGGGASGASRLLKRLCFSAGYPRGVLRKAGYPIDGLPTLRVRGPPSVHRARGDVQEPQAPRRLVSPERSLFPRSLCRVRELAVRGLSLRWPCKGEPVRVIGNADRAYVQPHDGRL